jgi:hypothetical protein
VIPPALRTEFSGGVDSNTDDRDATALYGYNSKVSKHSTLCAQTSFDFLPLSLKTSSACHTLCLQLNC